MAKYIYVGSRAEIVGTRFVFTEFGQPIELEKPEIEMLVDAGIHLIPEADFAATQTGKDPVRAAWIACDSFKKSLKEVEETING
jgi:hypothetical protein